MRGEDIKIKRPEQFVHENKIKKGSENKMQRRKKEIERKKSSTVKKMLKKDTVGLLVRVHLARHAADEIKSTLRSLNLHKKYDAVFVNLDEDQIRALKPIDAYVAYGYVTKSSVEELIHRRAYTTANGRREPLSDNMMVEQLVGDKGMVCLNDVSDEIYRIGENFEAATSILAPFKLASPEGNYEQKVLKKHDEVTDMGGFIGDQMEEFLNKIL